LKSGAAKEGAGLHEAFRVRIRVATQVSMAFPCEAGSRPAIVSPIELPVPCLLIELLTVGILWVVRALEPIFEARNARA
jgi:hypothetical protein